MLVAGVVEQVLLARSLVARNHIEVVAVVEGTTDTEAEVRMRSAVDTASFALEAYKEVVAATTEADKRLVE